MSSKVKGPGDKFATAHNGAERGSLLLVNLTTGETSVHPAGTELDPGLDDVIYTATGSPLSAEQGQAMLDVADMFAAVQR